MSSIVLVILSLLVTFACALGLCEWIVRRGRNSSDDGPGSPAT